MQPEKYWRKTVPQSILWKWNSETEQKQLGLCLTAQAAPDFCQVLWYLWTFVKYLWTEKRFWRLNRDTLSERVRAKLRANLGGEGESIFSARSTMPIRSWWWPYDDELRETFPFLHIEWEKSQAPYMEPGSFATRVSWYYLKGIYLLDGFDF